MNNCQELATTAQELGLDYQILTKNAGAEYIQRVINKFNPGKLTGHLAIHRNSVKIPFDKYEVTYPEYMIDESIYIFFEQKLENIDCVFILNKGNKLNEVLKNTYRFEYFQSNESVEYLLAINWYVIEGTGSAIEWMKSLQ